MRVGVLGTGMVGRALAGKALPLWLAIVMKTGDPVFNFAIAR